MLGSLLCGAVSCGSEDEGGGVSSGVAASRDDSRDRSTGPSRGGSALPVQAEPRGPFTAWLPQDSLLVVRIPREARSAEAWMQTALARAWRELGLDDGLGQLAANWSDELVRQWSTALEWGSLADSLGGELLFAVVAVHPEAIEARSDVLPFSGVLYAELDGPREPVLRAVESVVRHAGGTPDFEGLADGTYRGRIDTDPCRFEFRLSDREFALGLAPPGSMEGGLERYMRLEPHESFLASDLLRSMPTQTAGTSEIGAMELFVNFTPLWKMLLALAPVEVQQAFRGLRLEHVAGLSLVMGLEGGQVSERLRVHAARGTDVLSRSLTEEIDPSFLKWIPDRIEEAALFAWSPRRTLSTLKEMLPESMQATLQAGLEEGSRALDIDLEDDLLASLGPHVAIASSGSLEDADLQFTVAIECRRADSLSRWVDRRLGRANLYSSRRVYHAGKQPFFGLAMPELPGVAAGYSEVFEPSYAFVDGVLLLGSSPSAMTRTLTAAEAGGKLAPRELIEALADAEGGLWSVGYADLGAQFEELLPQLQPFGTLIPGGLPFTDEQWAGFCGRLGSSVNLSRRDELGFEFHSRSSLGVATTALLAGGVGFVAAVAMPNLAAAQSDLHEAKVVGVLHEIEQAQRRFKELAMVDADGDGEAEYGTLAELAGVAAVRGRGASLSPPLIDPSLGNLVGGCVQKEGYLFRLSLPDEAGVPHHEEASGGAPRAAHPDGAEWGWVVYAWPVHLGGSTRRVFVIDHSGEVYVTDNDGAGAYVGLESAPAADAAYLKPDLRARGTRSVRRGRDGALWLRESP